jgi:hypothetical protein
MSITINGSTNTITAPSGVTVGGALSVTGNATLGDASGDTVSVQAGTALLPTIIPSGDTNTGIWFPTADTVAVSTGGTERMRIDSAGLVTLSAGQIKFPATQNASADANTLDDYEEGTWTPVLTAATPGDLSVSYTTQSGTYTKIGRAVTVTFAIITSAFTHTTASGLAKVTALPFTPSLPVNTFARGGMQVSGFTKANYTNYCVQVGTSDTGVYIGLSGSGQTATIAVITEFTTGGTVIYSGTVTYQTA